VREKKLKGNSKRFPRICNAPLRGLFFSLYINDGRNISSRSEAFQSLHRERRHHLGHRRRRLQRHCWRYKAIRGLQYTNSIRAESIQTVCLHLPYLLIPFALLFSVGQNRQGGTGCKWFRCRREHVRKESAATLRGVSIHKSSYRINILHAQY
jgi:hypothetical protein